jgi:hypothetical protein
MADVMRRAARRREPRLGWRWKQSLLLSALLTAFFAGVIEGPQLLRAFGSAAFFIAALAALTYLQKVRVSDALNRYVAEQYGPSAPFTFEIEITSDGIITKQLGEEIRREWKSVEKVTAAAGGIEFDIRLGGMVFVRDTGFHSAEDRTKFLELAKQYSRR